MGTRLLHTYRRSVNTRGRDNLKSACLELPL
jgi:hypothetical protein